MELFQAILTRRSTRKYLPRPVEMEKLEKVIEAGRYAPSGSNSQSTRFFVMTDPAVLGKLASLVKGIYVGLEGREGLNPAVERSIAYAKKDNYVFYYGSPVLIVCANKKDYGNNIADCSCALENMMLAANGLDLGSCWINHLKWLNEDPQVLAFFARLGLQEDERIYGALALGYPNTETGLPRREPLPREGNPVIYIK